ncbi:dihydrolipoyl dehydrogenase [Clostridia bacterium]|nr:dihydrolipoyl dehydrogenase [Clostridia bacterium]
MIDLTVLGGGAAGCRAAMLAARAGFSVVLLEGGALGGAAAHEGYWAYRHLLRDAGAGENPYDLARENMRAATETQVRAARDTLRSLGVEIVRANGHVKGLRNRRYVVTTDDNFYESRRLLIAAGSIASAPDALDLEKARGDGMALSPRDLLNMPSAMKVLVLGGTLNDLRMAAWLAANKVSVTLSSPGERIAEELDGELCEWIKSSQRLGSVQYLTDAKLASLGNRRAIVSTLSGGQTVQCERVILGGRRRPATRGIGLGHAAVAMDGAGAVITDLTCRTNLPDVYAAGDVNGRSQTALGAFLEAEVCVSNMLGEHRRMAYNALPSIFRCGFSCASVGDTEESAAAKNIRAVSVTVPVGGRHEDGFAKILADDGGRVIGAHLCHVYEGVSVIWALAGIIEKSGTARAAARKIMPDSLLSDAVQQALLQF